MSGNVRFIWKVNPSGLSPSSSFLTVGRRFLTPPEVEAWNQITIPTLYFTPDVFEDHMDNLLRLRVISRSLYCIWKCDIESRALRPGCRDNVTALVPFRLFRRKRSGLCSPKATPGWPGMDPIALDIFLHWRQERKTPSDHLSIVTHQNVSSTSSSLVSGSDRPGNTSVQFRRQFSLDPKLAQVLQRRKVLGGILRPEAFPCELCIHFDPLTPTQPHL